jgi:hypothetical protein
MTATPPHGHDGDARAWHAVADLHHAAFTGLVLATIVRCGTPVAAELVERVFARQREARFLEGLRKLGIDRLPHAVACAQYHYLSNDVGGVAVEFMPESDRKAWVRYVPPRWIWAGTALCAVPDEITAAMLRGWHARNGESLGNPRLGFVCTKTTTAGDAALEGYYLEHDRPLAPGERLRFARDEEGPAFDPAKAPALAASAWPPARLAKARRNYAMEYLRTALPVAVEVLGADGAERVARIALRQVGLQHHRDAAASIGAPPHGDATAFARFLVAMARGQGDRATVLDGGAPGGPAVVEQSGPRLLDGVVAPVREAAIGAWTGLWEGALASHDRGLALAVVADGPAIRWTIAPRARAGR